MVLLILGRVRLLLYKNTLLTPDHDVRSRGPKRRSPPLWRRNPRLRRSCLQPRRRRSHGSVVPAAHPTAFLARTPLVVAHH